MQTLDNLQSLSFFLPEFALIAGVLLVVFWDLMARGTSRIIGIVSFALAALATSCIISVGYLVNSLPSQKLFYGLLAFDAYANLFRIVFACIGAIIIIFAVPAPETGAGTEKRKGAGEFFALLLVITLGLNLMVMSRNLLMIYLSIELVSVLSFVLAGFKLKDRRSSEGALKYVIFGGMASGVMLYGMSWLYGLAQSLDLAEIAARVALETANEGHIPLAILVGVICMLAGFGYKISAAPFHMWTPDVYEGAPTSITAFLSVGPKAAGFAILVRFFAEALQATAQSPGGLTPWAFLGGLLAMATMIVGNFTALHQNNVKRMLAFSSIAHAGYMLLGFCVFSDSGVKAIVFYIVVYAFMNLGAFLVVAAVAERHNDDESIESYYGLGTRAPVLAVMMAIFLFSLTGLPPFAGFIGKFYIFAALVRAGGSWNWILAAVGVVNSAVSLFYYARILRAMYLTAPTTDKPFSTRLSWSTTAVALAIPTIVLGVYWAPIYDLVARSVSGP
ncbi:MAG TPA: NADH-quinone oxidoreductase subunit N [Polyangiaceae bacterium]|nr:MAG: NADH-quinone oxidoreductase subunit N [Deltaproteobacteria bacterium ADurb.Bin207]HNS96842.1 NADH-quinone oxidoreductase subunit N [Polyangiaceae bacterium]HNZ21575.1 NADH-quinone oxidoreductase subunit N [Polyangiaceae bacterium]HOD21715.1 NADH-quinone oxidoreductase subunit N [Polyangiaceae bacterium]HOE48126.1 NADH-quinone oxidoreductase subunit N [Polyangiaceae bacterium]